MNPLSESEVVVVKIVVDRFLNLRESTLRKGLLLKVRSLETLDRLVRWTILKSHDQKNYLPLALAFYYCGDAQISSFAKQSVRVVCHVLRNLFENDQSEDTQFTPAEIETHTKKMYDAVVPEQIRLGCNFANVPPEDTSYLTTRLWDKHLPAWRSIFLGRKKEPMDPEDEKRMVEEINRLAGSPDLKPHDERDIDKLNYAMVERRLAPKKGKWLRFSEEQIHRIVEDEKKKSQAAATESGETSRGELPDTHPE